MQLAHDSKTVLYTGSVFEYIRAWRFQPLAQGQSRMKMYVCQCHQHEHGDDCHKVLAGCVLLCFLNPFVELPPTALPKPPAVMVHHHNSQVCAHLLVKAQ